MKFTLSLHLQQLKMHLQMISTFSFLNHIIGILRASNINVFSILHSFSKEFAVKKLCVRFFLLWRNLKDYYTKNYNNSSIPLLYFSIFLSYCTLKDDFFHFPAFITQLSKVELYAARAAELEMELCHQFVCK